MANKYIEILKSPRFQMIVLGAITHGLTLYRDSKDVAGTILIVLIEIFTGATVVGTVDKFSQANLASARALSNRHEPARAAVNRAKAAVNRKRTR